ncbi:MAG TPA: CvpA family protein [Bacillota bacterium]
MIILLFIAWGALSGLRLGLARAVTSLAGFLAGWAVAALLTGQVLAAADAQWGIIDSLAGSFQQMMPPQASDIPVVEAYREQLASRLGGQLALGPRPEPDGGAAVAPIADPSVAAVAGEPFPRLLAWGVAGALTFALLFAATRIAFALVGRLLHSAFDAGPLRLLNRLAGAVFGTVRNLLVASVVLGLLAPAAVIGSLAGFGGLMDGSAYAPLLLRVFYMVSPWMLGAPPASGA